MENEKRLIDANALRVYRGINVGANLGGLTAIVLEKDIRNAPTVHAVEVVNAKWEKRTDVIGFVRCSNCHDCNIYDDWADGKKWNYCPNCGAKMDGGDEDG